MVPALLCICIHGPRYSTCAKNAFWPESSKFMFGVEILINFDLAASAILKINPLVIVFLSLALLLSQGLSFQAVYQRYLWRRSCLLFLPSILAIMSTNWGSSISFRLVWRVRNILLLSLHRKTSLPMCLFETYSHVTDQSMSRSCILCKKLHYFWIQYFSPEGYCRKTFKKQIPVINDTEWKLRSSYFRVSFQRLYRWCYISVMTILFLKMMEYAVFFHVGHANSQLARSIWLPCAADLPISHIG